jgi:hemolysin III
MNGMDEMPAIPKRTQSTREELANSLSHGIGFIAALVGTPILLWAALQHGSAGFFIGTVVFTSTMLLLYLGSTLYHAWPQTRMKSILRVLDHSAIFLLIAGTYTPFALVTLNGPWGWTLFGAVWGLAALGIVQECWVARGARVTSLIIYVIMGWLALIAVKPLFAALSGSGMAWVVGGGIVYTLGIVFYVFDERVRHFHGIWHLFVMGGSGAHFVAIASFVA